jgi:hypothetical protein
MSKIKMGKSHTITPIEIKDIFAPNNSWGKVPEVGSITFKKGIFGNAKYSPEKHFVEHYFYNALRTRFANVQDIADFCVDWFDDDGNELDHWRVTFAFITHRPFAVNDNLPNSISDMLKGIEDCLKNALIALKRDTKK